MDPARMVALPWKGQEKQTSSLTAARNPQFPWKFETERYGLVLKISVCDQNDRRLQTVSGSNLMAAMMPRHIFGV